MNINCYFTGRDSGFKFQLTVYRQQGTKAYVVINEGIDFTISPVDCLYQIKVETNSKGRIVFKDTFVIDKISDYDVNFAG